MEVTVGDKIAIPANSRSWWSTTYVIATVISVTAAQFRASTNSNEFQIRRKDGKIIGKDYHYAVKATEAIIAHHEKEIETNYRTTEARKKLSDLDSKVIHKLTLDQLEYLAESWGKVKAMSA